jgi:hypothetical protein
MMRFATIFDVSGKEIMVISDITDYSLEDGIVELEINDGASIVIFALGNFIIKVDE